tara:strand:+ start:12058 stop:12246 length:189 start_codon:yes stop_codon:yes gene_type:complete
MGKIKVTSSTSLQTHVVRIESFLTPRLEHPRLVLRKKRLFEYLSFLSMLFTNAAPLQETHKN